MVASTTGQSDSNKLVYEALIRLVWKGFLSWLQANHTEVVVHMDTEEHQ